MFAIGLSILNVLIERERRGEFKLNRRYATGLMLMTTFAASIGGLATPIGTAPNIIGLGYIRKTLGVEIPFFTWSLIGVPVVIGLFAWLAFYLTALSPAGVRELPGSREMIEQERKRLGRWTTGQISTAVTFGLTVLMWITPGVIALTLGEQSGAYKRASELMNEGVAALVGAVLLFVLPGDREGRAITWNEAVKIDWGVVLLYGGGIALGTLMIDTGLAKAVGDGLTRLLPVQGSPLGMLIAATAVAAILSETTSNTASATMIVPVVIARAQSAKVDPLEPALGATMGASLGFMLRVSTRCNAIVYGSGYIPITRMMKYGIMLDVVGVGVIVGLVRLIVPHIR
jgi:sodium-dependent dicarboxylate transporter 2/3/5